MEIASLNHFDISNIEPVGQGDPDDAIDTRELARRVADEGRC